MKRNEEHIEVGTVIEERYRIEAVIGEGGFGVVYRAEQLRTSQHVAIKVLQPEKLMRSSDPEQEIERFRREMRLIATINHPNIVRLIDSGQLDNGDLFMVLEYVDGMQLGEVLEEEGALRPKEARRLMMQVLEALNCAHTAGVVHRDLKPANIMVTDVGGRRSALVLDFGIAGLEEDARGEDYVRLTQTGQVHGTPAYMAPEQLEGKVTAQTDIYAWGLVFLECLTGKPAFTGDSFASIIYKQLSPEPVAMPEALEGDGLGGYLRRALAKKPEERFATAAIALAELENVEVLGPSSVNPVISNAGFNRAQITGELGSPETQPISGDGDTVAMEAAPERSTQRELEADGGGGETISETAQALLGEGDGEGEGGRPLGVIIGAAALAAAVVLGVLFFATDLFGPSGDEVATPTCPEGQVATRDTHGHCCWPGQVWNNRRCVGVPERCPEGLHVDKAGQRCALPPCGGGKVRTADGQHCCWPEQGWSESDQQCKGTPACPDSTVSHTEDEEPTCLRLSEGAVRAWAACNEGGDLKACTQLAHAFQEGKGAERSDSLAIELFERVCKNSVTLGCYKLGFIYLSGLGVEPEPSRSIDYFEMACESNELPAACHTLAWIHASGQGTTVDTRKALLYFEKACNQNHIISCDNLGLMYHYGDGVPRDDDKARELLQRACTSNPYACTHLGWVLETSPRTDDDIVKAAELYERACHDSDSLACVNAAALFEQGKGVPQNLSKARDLYDQACKDQWHHACVSRDALKL